MHGLEDMRLIDDHWTCKNYIWEVNEDGSARHVVEVETFPNAIPQSARPMFAPLYRCGCGQEFGSWEEAQDHIVWDDQ